MSKTVEAYTLNFAEQGVKVKLNAYKAKGDEQGNDIIKTYATKKELTDELLSIDASSKKASEAAKQANDAMRDAKANADAAVDCSAAVAEAIRKAVEKVGSSDDIDTILAGSIIANLAGKTPSVELNLATALVNNVNAININNQRIVNAYNKLCEVIQILANRVLYSTERFGDIKDYVEALTLVAASPVSRVTTGGNFSTKTSVCGSGKCGNIVCGVI